MQLNVKLFAVGSATSARRAFDRSVDRPVGKRNKMTGVRT